MAPAAEHLDCNCFPGHLICSELLSGAGRALRAAWVPAAGQAGCIKLTQFQPCSPSQAKLLYSALPHLNQVITLVFNSISDLGIQGI